MDVLRGRRTWLWGKHHIHKNIVIVSLSDLALNHKSYIHIFLYADNVALCAICRNILQMPSGIIWLHPMNLKRTPE